MKKSLSYAIMLLTAVVFLSGCSIGGVNKKERDPITVKVMTYSDNDFSKFKNYIQNQFPHITIETVDLFSLLNKENIQLGTGNERIREIILEQKADFYFRMTPEAYVGENDLEMLDLAPLLQRDNIELNDIQQQMVADATVNGKLPYLSPTFDREVLFINRKLFQESGTAEPTGPISWNEFRELAKSVADGSPDSSGYQLESFGWQLTYQTIANYNGLRLVDENNQLMPNREEWKQLAQQLVQDIQDGLLSTVETFQSSYQNDSKTGMFIGDVKALYRLQANNATADEWSMIGLPTPFNGDYDNPRNQLMPSSMFQLDSKSPHTEALWEVVAHLMSKEAAAHIANDMMAPGLITYQEQLSFGSLKLDAFTGPVEIRDRAAAGQLTNEAYAKLNEAFRSQFEAIEKTGLEFEQGWANIEKVVDEINGDLTNFE
ncbi:ABC transporter substrate-binding protein [Paenibacillus sp. GCM10027627]|uniref:ABC transporter substrate-binding protein n=1 Tax=unclassified Paenibacillus TaxID=185978 RepID=UPI003625DB0D